MDSIQDLKNECESIINSINNLKVKFEHSRLVFDKPSRQDISNEETQNSKVRVEPTRAKRD